MSQLGRGGRTGIAFLAGVLGVALAAPWLAPRPPDLQEDVAGARYLPPLTRAHALRVDDRHVRIVTSLRAIPMGWEFVRSGRRERVERRNLLDDPSRRFYLLGTDGLGRDLASRLLFGARHSFGIGVVSVALALALGVAAGAAAGLVGGALDVALSGIGDVLRSIPRLLIYLVCASLFVPSTLLLVLVLGLTTWTSLARIVRAQMLSLRASDLSTAARALGSPPWRTLLKHLLPQIGPVLVVASSLRFADTVLLESALSLLGLGSPPPAVSLGSLLASGREALSQAWWIAAWPGLLITSVVLALRSTASLLSRLSDPPSLS